MKSLVLLNMRGLRARIAPILTAWAVLLVLLTARKVWDVPKPFIIALGLCFLGWCLVFWWLQLDRVTSIVQSLTYLLIPWGLISLSLLGGVYYFDRGGWNWYQVSGYNGSIAEELVADVLLSPAEFVKRHPGFILDPADETRVVLPRGEYVISHTVVFPKSSALLIEPGAMVKMDVGCSLISYSPIKACGTLTEPITFCARNRWFKWGTIGLVQAGQAVFEHVRIEHARQAVVNGTDFPGGLSFIETDGEIKNCRFINMFGKDAIYIRHGHMVIRDNRVEVAFKDGIDFDGSSGEIRGNLLIDCDDEGIDLSENVAVDVQQNTIRDRHGGRIAANYDLDRIRSANILEYSKSE